MPKNIDIGTHVINIKTRKIGVVQDWSDLFTANGQRSFAFKVEVDGKTEIWPPSETAPWEGKTSVIDPPSKKESVPESEKKGLIFISCGQNTPEEISLGNSLFILINEATSYHAYFAEKQTSLKGLTENIFSKLYECVGLVAVMHSRGEFKSLTNESIMRASVWIEQEIAIASFIQQTLKKDIEVILYAQKGLTIEGVRKYLHLNPVFFKKDSEVLEDFENQLKQGKFKGLLSKKVSESTKPSMVQILEEFLKTKLLHIELLMSSGNPDFETVAGLFQNLKNAVHIAFGDLELKQFLSFPGIDPQKTTPDLLVSLSRMREYLTKRVLGNFNLTWLSDKFKPEELAPYEGQPILVRSTSVIRAIYLINGKTKQRVFEADLVGFGIFQDDDPRIQNVSSEQLEKFKTV